jgi:hypothetical protein
LGFSGGIHHFDVEKMKQVQLDMHLALDWSSSGNASKSLRAYETKDPERYLGIIDWFVAHEENPSRLRELQHYLDSGASAYTIHHPEGFRPRLVDRINPTITDLIQNAAPPHSRAEQHLQLSWLRIYGREKDASSGYREAIRAVEAAAKPLVSPNNPSTTLGTLISNMSDKPSKWTFSLSPEAIDTPIETVINLMHLLWKAQLDRHGTDDELVPLVVSPEEAETALHTSALLVFYFSAGPISLTGEE